MDDAQIKRYQESRRDLEERLYNRQRIQTVFARFGGDVCRTIWEEFRRHQGMAAVLQRLGLPPARTLDLEFEAVQRFLNENSAGLFMRRVRPHEVKLD